MCGRFPYETLIGESVIKIPRPKVRRLQWSIPKVKEKYLKCLEEIFEEHKMKSTTDALYRETKSPLTHNISKRMIGLET